LYAYNKKVDKKLKIKSKILIIAGSDSSGGAGIQADIKTITSLGSYAMTAITSITAQNTKGVNSVLNLNSRIISDQIEYTTKDIKPDAVKIGMLSSVEAINAVSKSIKAAKLKKIILDPVMVTTSGIKLINNNAINFLKKKLIKEVNLITPNIPEAEILTNVKIKTVEDMIVAIKKIIKNGGKNVLLKGGHLKSDKCVDIFANNKEIKMFINKRYSSKNTHGTGCTLASAVATHYSCGKTLKKSCSLSIKYVNECIKSAPNFGKGNGPINHINNIFIKNK